LVVYKIVIVALLLRNTFLVLKEMEQLIRKVDGNNNYNIKIILHMSKSVVRIYKKVN